MSKYLCFDKRNIFGSSETMVKGAFLIKSCSALIVLVEVVGDFYLYCHFFLRNNLVNMREAWGKQSFKAFNGYRNFQKGVIRQSWNKCFC